MPNVLPIRDTWWFCLFYAVTFGGFVGLASFLNVFFLSQYGLTRIQAGNFATLCVIAGSFLRPLGGYLSTASAASGCSWSFTSASESRSWAFPPCRRSAGARAALRGDGAAWHGQRRGFPDRPATILPGDRRGDRHRRRGRWIGGFLLPNLLGSMKQATGSFSGGFLTFALARLLRMCRGAVLREPWLAGRSDGGKPTPLARSPRRSGHWGRPTLSPENILRYDSMRCSDTIPIQGSRSFMGTAAEPPFSGLVVATFEARMARRWPT